MNSSLTTGKKRMRLILHIVAWLIIFAFPFYWLSQQTGRPSGHFGRFYVQSVSYVCFFYISFFWLVPKFWLAGKKWMFLLLTLGVITVIYGTISWAEDRYFKPPVEFRQQEQKIMESMPDAPNPDRMRKRFFLSNFLFTSVLISGFCVGLRVSEKLAENEEKRKELEKEKLNSELAFLKNQVSPHFFFNTLNNIYSLIAINQSDAQESVLKLSKLMRYLLYESERGTTTLGQEVAFMRNYIDLMRLRLSDRVNLKSDFPDDYPDVELPPLIFIPFIENAFKHGISYQQESFIRISMRLEDNSLIFNCLNSIGHRPAEGPAADSGIGLDNVRKRLQLLYPDRHQLEILEDSGTYRVSLEIRLQPEEA